MNGDKMLEALSFIDEKYIDEADAPAVRKKNYWLPLAAMAACFGLILFGWNQWNPLQAANQSAAVIEKAMMAAPVTPVAEETPTEMVMFAMESKQMLLDASAVPEEAMAMEEADITAASLLCRIPVRVTQVSKTTFTAVVTESGLCEAGKELTIALPENGDIQVDAMLIILCQQEDLEAEILEPAGMEPAQ